MAKKKIITEKVCDIGDIQILIEEHIRMWQQVIKDHPDHFDFILQTDIEDEYYRGDSDDSCVCYSIIASRYETDKEQKKRLAQNAKAKAKKKQSKQQYKKEIIALAKKQGITPEDLK